ncbi:UNVERIFIED_CONTAM: hypothetical protein Sindi_2478100 [Sesamum indicum]
MRAPVAWEEICHPKEEGDFGIRHIPSWNVALLARVLWNIHRKGRHFVGGNSQGNLGKRQSGRYFSPSKYSFILWLGLWGKTRYTRPDLRSYRRKNHARCASTLMNRPSTFSLSVPSVTMYGLVSAMAWHQPTYVTLLREVKWLKKEKTGSSV